MHIAVLGAGPIGIEAAVAATDAGHTVTVYEQGPQAAWAVAAWGHVTLFTPWSMNTTAAGRARVGAAGLDGADFPTAAQWRAAYLLPLAATLDLRCEQRVAQVGRLHLRKGDLLGQAARVAEPFRLLVDGPQGERFDEADAVLDCTGTWGDPAPAGPGGLPVPGEAAARAAGLLRYGPVPVGDLAGRRVLLLGDGASAVTVLQELLALSPPARITWLTPSSAVPGFHSPEDDVLPGRRALWTLGRQAAARVDHRGGAWLAGVEVADGALRVALEGGDTLVVDHAVVATGFRPDNGPLRELQFHACWGSEGPMKLAADLLATRGGGGGDCLASPQGGGAEVLRSPEPRLFVLGSKSFGRRSDFLLQEGHRQVAQVLELLAR